MDPPGLGAQLAGIARRTTVRNLVRCVIAAATVSAAFGAGMYTAATFAPASPPVTHVVEAAKNLDQWGCDVEREECDPPPGVLYLEPCVNQDDYDCVWWAAEHGNGIGTD